MKCFDLFINLKRLFLLKIHSDRFWSKGVNFFIFILMEWKKITYNVKINS